MPQSSVDDALAGYRRFHRALMTSTARKWRDLDISMQQVRAMHVLRDEGDVAVGRLAACWRTAWSVPATPNGTTTRPIDVVC